MGVGEGLADDAVDDPDGLRGEPATVAVAAAVPEELGVERVEVLGWSFCRGIEPIRGAMWSSRLLRYDANVVMVNGSRGAHFERVRLPE